MVGDNKRQADSMYRVYRRRQCSRLISGDAYPVGLGIFSYARTFLSNPSTLIDNPVERADLDRTTDEDFLPGGTPDFCGESLCSGKRNNFYLMLKNVLQDNLLKIHYPLYFFSHTHKIEKYFIWTNPQIIKIII